VPLVAALRRSSGEVPISIDYGDAKIAAQFKKADRFGARAALILGDDELLAGTVVVRDLVTRRQDAIAAHADDATTAAGVLRWYRALPRKPQEAA
jgi:histidyl-tRNA synthetase